MINLTEIKSEHQRILDVLPQFIESLALPGKPFGRFKFHSAQKQPWLLYASQQMLSLAVISDYWNKIDDTRKHEWLDLLLSSQDRASGLFICPAVRIDDIAEPDNWDRTSYFTAITTKLTNRLLQLGVTPRYPLPNTKKGCPHFEELSAALENLSWDRHVYGAGSHAGRWACVRLQELRSKGESLQGDPYVMKIIGFLEGHQNPDTGFWGSSMDLTDGMNGTLKTLSIFEMLGRRLPNSERIIDSVLSIQREDGRVGEGCSNWNAMALLTYLLQESFYRLENVQKVALRLTDYLKALRQPDGLYSVHENGCLHVHAGVILCDSPQPVSDIQGTSHALQILCMTKKLHNCGGVKK